MSLIEIGVFNSCSIGSNCRHICSSKTSVGFIHNRDVIAVVAIIGAVVHGCVGRNNFPLLSFSNSFESFSKHQCPFAAWEYPGSSIEHLYYTFYFHSKMFCVNSPPIPYILYWKGRYASLWNPRIVKTINDEWTLNIGVAINPILWAKGLQCVWEKQIHANLCLKWMKNEWMNK